MTTDHCTHVFFLNINFGKALWILQHKFTPIYLTHSEVDH